MKTNRTLPCYLAALLHLALLSVSLKAQVTTWRYDLGRTGQNLTETKLTPANVNTATFGKLRSYKVDGYVYAQPLYLPAINVGGSTRNVVFVATEHESVYAFDADRNLQLWKVSLVDVAHGAAVGATSVPSADVGTNDLVPEIGITATPVIDPLANTIYVEAKSKENGGYVHRLHALDVLTGNERPNSPVLIEATVAGGGSGSVLGRIAFQARWQLERAGLLLLNGKVYLAFASHGDNGPYHGWVLGYDAVTLQPAGVYNSTPNGSEAGIWQSGAGLAADNLVPGGRMFVVNGNGETNDGLPYTDDQNFGNAIERLDLDRGIHVADQWTPFDTDALSAADADQGSGGIVLLPDQTGAHPHELVQIGKNGRIEVLDRDNLGGIDATQNHVVQEIENQVQGLWSTPAYWNGNLYIWAAREGLKQFSVKDGLLSTTPIARGSIGSNFPGASPIVTANGNANAILWALRTDNYWSGTPALLYAFDANDVSKILWSNDQNTARDAGGIGVKFTVPMAVDGKVFVGTQGQVDVYGLLSENSMALPPVTFSPVPGTYATTQTITLSVAQPAATIYYTTDGSIPTSSSKPYTRPFAIEGTTSILAVAIADGYDNGSTSTGNYIIGAAPVINHGNGFSSVEGLTLNGSAVNSDDSRLQLTSGGYSQAGSAFSNIPVDIRTFATDFTFQLSGIRPLADGFTFTLQNSGLHALGQSGGGLGYGPENLGGPPAIGNSIAVKFDLWGNNGESWDSTGLYVNGVSPTVPYVDLTYTGLDLSSGDTISAHLAYDGKTLFLTLTDPVAAVSYSTSFIIDIPRTIGSNTAYAGFTGATGGFTASQKILTWTMWSNTALNPPPTVPMPEFSPAPALYSTAQTVTVTDVLRGAAIYCTTDGTMPIASSPRVSGALTVANTTMLQCLAMAPGYPDSRMVHGIYTIPVSTPPIYSAPAPVMAGTSSGLLVPVSADFNSDGKADLAIINVATSSVSVMAGVGDGSFQPAVSYLAGRGPAGLVTADFNEDGRPDLAVADSLEGSLSILLNDGTGVFAAANTRTVKLTPGVVHVSTGDFNNDGHLDLAVTNSTTGTVTILFGTGGAAFQTVATYTGGRSPLGTAVADFNGDGYLDLVAWNSGDNTVSVLLNDGTGRFLAQKTYATGTDPSSVSVRDLNGDGFPDLTVANLVDGTVSVLLNDGTGRFLPQVKYPAGLSPWSVLATDTNGDGIPDLVVSNSGDATLSLLIGKGDGTLLPQVAVSLGKAPYMAVAADFNGDGRPDLAVTTYSPASTATPVPVRSTARTRATDGPLVNILLQAGSAPAPFSQGP